MLSPKSNTMNSEGTTAGSAASLEMIPSLSDFSIEKTDPRLPCHIIPFARNRGFFGRAAVLKNLDDALCPSIEAGDPKSSNPPYLRTFKICGPGGMGKTQLAAEFLYRCKAPFDAIVWVQADEVVKIAQGFTYVAIKLGLITEDSVEARDQVLTRELVLGWLANPLKSYNQEAEADQGKASWVLVFDNVDNPDILDSFWPSGSSGSVLITSRDPLVKTYNSSDHSGIMLPAFEVEEATDFLLSLTGREMEEDEQKSGTAVAETLGGLPLALTEMAGVMSRRGLTFSEFLQQYEVESAREELFTLQVENPGARTGNEYEHTLATVWALDNLREGGPLLDVLSFLDPDGIPEYIFEANQASAGGRTHSHTNDDYQQARTKLLQSSLIARDHSAEKIVVHRLIQDAARARLSDEQYDTVFTSVLCRLSSVWPYEEFGFGNETYRWARCEELYAHVLRSQKYFWKWHQPSRLSVENMEPLKLLLDVGW